MHVESLEKLLVSPTANMNITGRSSHQNRAAKQHGGGGVQGIQEERVAKLVELLRNKLQPYVQGDKDGWTRRMVEEAEDLSSAAFGEAMLSTIGWVLLCSWVVPSTKRVGLMFPGTPGDTQESFGRVPIVRAYSICYAC